jgi:hypothetical protein
MAFLDLGQNKPFIQISQNTVSLLESITASEKAQAVPLLKIWEIDPFTGRALGQTDADGNPLQSVTLDLVRPASFGSSVDELRFRERPPASMDNVSIVTEAPIGVILYRKINLSLTVHRPDVIFQEAGDAQVWSSLILPGRAFCMEYGWRASTAVKNGIINGLDHVDDKTKTVVPSAQRIRFVTTNYKIRVTKDAQIAVDIEAVEDGDTATRALPFAQQRDQDKTVVSEPIDSFSDEGLQLIQQMYDKVRKQLPKNKGSKGKPPTVTFRQLADTLFAPLIESAYRRLGYSIEMFLGNFNSKVGTCIPRYGGKSLSDKSIGDIEIPVSELSKQLADILRLGKQITMNNLLIYFLRLLNDPEIFENAEKTPDIRIKTVYANSARKAQIYLVDVRTELTKFDPQDKKEALVTGRPSREKIKELLDKKGIPMISFVKGNSYIEDSNFDVFADDQMKSIFIQRAFRKQGTRDEKVEQADGARLFGKFTEPEKVLYSSAIRGEITMLGNFAFDTFGMIWLDFGIPVWSGPFFIMSRHDQINAASFTTTIAVQSSGDDPLGTQGRNT